MTVLVATGERHIARLCEANLSRQGWSVHSAYDLDHACAFLRLNAPDLLVLDTKMEGQHALAEKAAALDIKVMELSE